MLNRFVFFDLLFLCLSLLFLLVQIQRVHIPQSFLVHPEQNSTCFMLWWMNLSEAEQDEANQKFQASLHLKSS